MNTEKQRFYLVLAIQQERFNSAGECVYADAGAVRIARREITADDAARLTAAADAWLTPLDEELRLEERR